MDEGHDPSDPSAVPDMDVGMATSTTSTAAAAAAAAAAQPHFEPLFTLLTNTTNNTTIHPRVHYLFSDDDPSILPGSAPLDSSHRALVLDLAPAATPSASAASPDHHQHGAAGWRVSWAASLSPSFAVTESNISVVQQGHRDDGSVMLRIDGVEREPVHLPRNTTAGAGGGGGGGEAAATASGGSPAASGTVGKEDVDALVDDFRRRMSVMAKVVGQGHKRREALDEQQQQDELDDYDGEDGVPQAYEDAPEGGDYEEPVSPTTQTHLQQDDSRWR